MADLSGTGQADHTATRRKRFVVVGICMPLLAGLMAACGDGAGFRPMYGSVGASGGATEQKLAQVDIATIPGRVGQQLRNEFIYQSTGGGARLDPAYRLEVAIRESVTSTLVQETGDARAQVYMLEANFKLVRIADNEVVMKGNSSARAGFERYTSIFSNVRAREDAENRAAKTIGEELKTRVSAFLSTTA